MAPPVQVECEHIVVTWRQSVSHSCSPLYSWGPWWGWHRYQLLVFVFLHLPSLIPFHCHLHHPSPLLHHPSLSFSTSLPILPNLSSHSPPISVSVLLFSFLPPSTLSASAHFVNCSPSICSTCPVHFNQLLSSFLLKLSFTPTSPLLSLMQAC